MKTLRYFGLYLLAIGYLYLGLLFLSFWAST